MAALPAGRVGPSEQPTGPPAASEVFRLRDFWAHPAAGRHGHARWQQTMGTVVLRLPLPGAAWHGVSEEEFDVSVCERGLRVACGRELAAARKGAEPLCGWASGELAHEVLPGCCWWHLDADPEAPSGGGRLLVIGLVKAQERSWQGPFLDAPAAGPADALAGWAALPPGRPAPADPPLGAGSRVRPAAMLAELVQSQTDELVSLHLVLHRAELDAARAVLAPSRTWGLDVWGSGLRVFVRGAEDCPLLSGRLCQQVVPSQTDWSMVKVTTEVAARADGVEARETRPALSIQLRKADGCRGPWDWILDQDQCCAAAQGPPVADSLCEEDQEALEHAAGGASELKARGDECFKKRQFDDAITLYSEALGYAPDNEKLLSNRSAARVEAGRFQEALDDALRCAELAPEWPKSFFRQGVALRGLRRYDMAISAFCEGEAREPGNPSWQAEVAATERARLARKAARARGAAR